MLPNRRIRTATRELEILHQLMGKSRRKRQRRTLEYPNDKYPPRGNIRFRPFCFKDLSRDVQELILDQVHLRSLFSMRLAGLGCEQEEERIYIRRLIRKRIADLKPIWDHCIGGSGIQSIARRRMCDPAQFSALRMLILQVGDWTTLPDGIGELRELTYLILDKGPSDRGLSSLPMAMQRCSKLRTVELITHRFKQFPRVLLKLPNLTNLDLRGNQFLKCLPEEIGHELVKLTDLNICGCPEIVSLPDSLLGLLNRNDPIRNLMQDSIPDSYFRTKQMRNKFPNVYHDPPNLP